jgi:hypothetical protein
MKHILGNRYVKVYRFTTSQEATFFVSNQKINNILSLEDTFGDNYYCYIGYHSLTSEKLFTISFSSDEEEENLSLLLWPELNLVAINTGRNIYLVDYEMNIKSSFDISTTLIGLYITKGNNMLILEEASLKLVSSSGKILQDELFDFIEDFRIDNCRLFIHTSIEDKVIELI